MIKKVAPTYPIGKFPDRRATFLLTENRNGESIMKYAYVLTSETKYWDKKIYGVYSSFNKAVNDALDLIEQHPDTCKQSETATNGRFTGLKITQWNMNKQTGKDEWYANQTETNMFVFAGFNN